MKLLAIPAVVIGVMTAYYLIHDGYEGPYMEDTMVTLMVQALFIGCICLGLAAFGAFSMTGLYVAIGVSFLPELIGWLSFKFNLSLPDKGDRKRKRIERTIRKGRKYREYADFVRENGDRIAALLYPCVVVYLPDRNTPFFTRVKGEYDITYDWNPKLGSPERAVSSGFRQTADSWQVKRFFEVGPGERQFTQDEMYALEYVVRDALPRPKSQWNGNLTNILRVPPAKVHIKDPKRPY